MRCKGKTLAGKRCSHQASYGNFCGHHKRKTTKKKKSPAKKKVTKKKKAPAKKSAPKKKSTRSSGRKTKWTSGKKLPGATYYWFIGSTKLGNLSNKYWGAKVSGSELIVHHGRVGSSGRIGRKKYSSPAAAKAELAKRKREKMLKGYMRISRNPGKKCRNPSSNDLQRGYKSCQAKKRRNSCGWHRKRRNP